MPHETSLMNSIHADFSHYSLSSVDIQSSVLIGRPYGGLTILFKKHLSVIGSVVNFEDKRLLGLKISYQNLNYLIINVYLPYYCEENTAEYTSYMGKLESILEESEVNGVIIIGDFNAKPNSEYFTQLTNLCSEYDLIVSDVSILPQETFSHINNASLKRSWLDHCVMSPSLHNAVTDMFFDNDTCISDHFPLYVTIDFSNLPIGITHSCTQSSNINWNFSDKYKSDLFYLKLSNVFDFNDINDFCFCSKSCHDINHCVQINSRWLNFIRAVKSTGLEIFGTEKREEKLIPGWNTYVKDLHRAARDQFKHWKRCGSPRQGEEAEAMRRSRAAFKHAIRRCRQQEEAMRAEALSLKLASGDSRAFWRSVGGGGGGAARPERVDGAVGQQDVANLWANKFGNVMNCVEDEHLQKQFFKSFNARTDSEVRTVPVEEVHGITSKLKLGKAVGLDERAFQK